MGETRRDYVQEVYEHFVRNAEVTDPTDPVKAVEAYFERNASDELKARCSAEGKDAQGCWRFITAVARKVGGNCCIDQGTVYAMAMHWFEEIPVDWSGSGAKPRVPEGAETAKADAVADVESPAEIPAKTAPARNAKAKARKPRSRQGSFLDMFETQQDGQSVDRTCPPQVGRRIGDGNEVAQSVQPASSSQERGVRE